MQGNVNQAHITASSWNNGSSSMPVANAYMCMRGNQPSTGPHLEYLATSIEFQCVT